MTGIIQCFPQKMCWSRCGGRGGPGVQGLQLGVVQQGLEVGPGEELGGLGQLPQVHVGAQRQGPAQRLQDLHAVLLESGVSAALLPWVRFKNLFFYLYFYFILLLKKENINIYSNMIFYQ